jgi:hypothetical protein
MCVENACGRSPYVCENIKIAWDGAVSRPEGAVLRLGKGGFSRLLIIILFGAYDRHKYTSKAVITAIPVDFARCGAVWNLGRRVPT